MGTARRYLTTPHERPTLKNPAERFVGVDGVCFAGPGEEPWNSTSGADEAISPDFDCPWLSRYGPPTGASGRLRLWVPDSEDMLHIYSDACPQAPQLNAGTPFRATV